MTSLNCRGLSGGLWWTGLLWRRHRAWHSCLTAGWLVRSATLAFSCIHTAATDCVAAAHEEVSCVKWRRNRATWDALAIFFLRRTQGISLDLTELRAFHFISPHSGPFTPSRPTGGFSLRLDRLRAFNFISPHSVLSSFDFI